MPAMTEPDQDRIVQSACRGLIADIAAGHGDETRDLTVGCHYREA
jgi:hypothetical protein